MSKLKNKYEVDTIIRKTLDEYFDGRAPMPFYADDSRKDIGHTYKYHRSSPFNKVWIPVLEKLHNLGLYEWQLSSRWDYSVKGEPVPANWLGIRNARLPRKK